MHPVSCSCVGSCPFSCVGLYPLIRRCWVALHEWHCCHFLPWSSSYSVPSPSYSCPSYKGIEFFGDCTTTVTISSGKPPVSSSLCGWCQWSGWGLLCPVWYRHWDALYWWHLCLTPAFSGMCVMPSRVLPPVNDDSCGILHPLMWWRSVTLCRLPRLQWLAFCASHHPPSGVVEDISLREVYSVLACCAFEPLLCRLHHFSYFRCSVTCVLLVLPSAVVEDCGLDMRCSALQGKGTGQRWFWW